MFLKKLQRGTYIYEKKLFFFQVKSIEVVKNINQWSAEASFQQKTITVADRSRL